MPTYVYRAVLKPHEKRPCEVCGGKDFEIVQRMADDALSQCPKCGGEVQRVITLPGLSGAGKVKKPSESSMAQAGFTQYKRCGKGYYEKSFGQGPTSLGGENPL
ncbi:MAG TPA: zinc ribbon domain-containing protein [Planctomycetota bacterium]